MATVFHFTAGVAAVGLSPCESQSQHAVADAGTEEVDGVCVRDPGMSEDLVHQNEDDEE